MEENCLPNPYHFFFNRTLYFSAFCKSCKPDQHYEVNALVFWFYTSIYVFPKRGENEQPIWGDFEHYTSFSYPKLRLYYNNTMGESTVKDQTDNRKFIVNRTIFF